VNDRPINNFLVVLGAFGCLAAFGYLIWMAKKMDGISTAQIVCLVIVFVVSLFLVAGQVRIVSSITSCDAEDE
jgi:hypothetical protein